MSSDIKKGYWIENSVSGWCHGFWESRTPSEAIAAMLHATNSSSDDVGNSLRTIEAEEWDISLPCEGGRMIRFANGAGILQAIDSTGPMSDVWGTWITTDIFRGKNGYEFSSDGERISNLDKEGQ